MSTEQHQLEAGIGALEAQRSLLGDAVVDASVAGMRAKLAVLQGASPALAEPTQFLKQVSILFLDVVGSTTLSQQLDPEEISAVMDGALSRGTAVVQAHQGKVLQYAGDNLLAVFGADEAKEDDPERAVRCGLALLELGRTLGAEVEATHGHAGFDVRVGIHTGGVLLGGGVDEGSIHGIGVNVAARMEQTAPAGALRISHDTYRHVRGVFDVEPQPPLIVKGVDEPFATYLVQRAKPRAFKVATRGIEGVETRMVGRDAELEQLQDAFRRLVQPGAGLQRVAVVADAGVGKSRLLYEFENWAEARAEIFYIFQGRATPPTQVQPYGLLRDVLAWRLQIADSDSMEAAKRKLEEGVMPLFVQDDGEAEAQAHAHLLGYLIGLDFADSKHISGIKEDGRQIRNRGFNAAAQMFRRISAQNSANDKLPIVLLLDDLHWADDASLDFLDYLTQVNRDVPMLMLTLTRPTLFERRSNTERAGEQRIDLYPLDKTGSRLLANELLKKLPDVPAALRELVTGGADGNPFYMEELVKMLIDQGAISTRNAIGLIQDDRWTLHADQLLSLKVPPTLTGVLQARLDGLPAQERTAMQLASVIGLHFWDQALAFVETAAAEQLGPLTRRELVIPREATGTGIDSAREFVFRHQILHRVTYDTVLKRRRKDVHAKAAQWFANSTGARAKDFVSLAAEHFYEAGDTVNAREYFTRAAEQAAATFANELALGYTERALKLCGPNDAATRWRLLANREATLDLLGKRAEQRADIDDLLALAETLDDDRLRAEAAWRRSNIALRIADWPTTEREARRALVLADRVHADAVALVAQRNLALAIARQGNPAEGRALASQALARAEALRLVRVQVYCVNTLSVCAELQGELAAFLTYAHRTLLLTREIGDRRMEATLTGNLGGAYLQLGALGSARQHLQDALRMNRALGNRQVEGNTIATLAALVLREGDDALALAHAQAAVEIAIEVGARFYECDAMLTLADAELALGRWAATAAAFDRAAALAREIDDPVLLLNALCGHARVALAQGRLEPALQGIERLRTQARANLADGDDESALFKGYQEHLIRLTIHQVWSRAGDPRADAALMEARTALLIRADAIGDAGLRHSFVTNIPAHREIMALWAARQAPRDSHI